MIFGAFFNKIYHYFRKSIKLCLDLSLLSFSVPYQESPDTTPH